MYLFTNCSLSFHTVLTLALNFLHIRRLYCKQVKGRQSLNDKAKAIILTFMFLLLSPRGEYRRRHANHIFNVYIETFHVLLLFIAGESTCAVNAQRRCSPATLHNDITFFQIYFFHFMFGVGATPPATLLFTNPKGFCLWGAHRT